MPKMQVFPKSVKRNPAGGLMLTDKPGGPGSMKTFNADLRLWLTTYRHFYGTGPLSDVNDTLLGSQGNQKRF